MKKVYCNKCKYCYYYSYIDYGGDYFCHLKKVIKGNVLVAIDAPDKCIDLNSYNNCKKYTRRVK